MINVEDLYWEHISLWGAPNISPEEQEYQDSILGDIECNELRDNRFAEQYRSII